MNSFYSATWENILYYILTTQLLMKYQNVFKQCYILQYKIAVTMVTYTEAVNIAFKTSKHFRKILKYKINIFYILKKTNLKV